MKKAKTLMDIIQQEKIYEGKFHEGLPTKGMLYTGDRKYHENNDSN